MGDRILIWKQETTGKKGSDANCAHPAGALQVPAGASCRLGSVNLSPIKMHVVLSVFST